LDFKVGEQMGDDTGVRSESESRTLMGGLAGDVASCFGFLKRGRGGGRGFMGSCVDVEGENSEAVALDRRVTELLGFNGILFFPRFEREVLRCSRVELSSSELSVSSEKLAMA
jgi:hypothetical protein